MSKIQKRFRAGDKVILTEDALDNYGRKNEGRVFLVESVSTRYMPSKEFFARGKPDGYHPGFDESSGSALYDLEGLGNSLYDWELEPATKTSRRSGHVAGRTASSEKEYSDALYRSYGALSKLHQMLAEMPPSERPNIRNMAMIHAIVGKVEALHSK